MIGRLGEYLLLLGPWNVHVLVASAALCTLVLGTRYPRLLVIASLGSYAALMLNPSVVAIPRVVDLRVIGLALVVYAAMLRQRLPRFSVLRGGIFPATMVYILFALALTPLASDAGLAAVTILQVFVTMVFVWTLLSVTTDDELRSAICWVSGAMVLGSLVWVQVFPGEAIAGGRWRGLTTNANSLGIFAGMFLVTTKIGKVRWSLLPVLVALLGSASRASAFGLGLVAGPKLLEGRSKTVRRFVAGLAIVAAIPILNSVFFSPADARADSSSLTRTSNSRGDFWAEGVDLIIAHPLRGVGVGSQPSLLSSSVLSPLVEIGLVALVPLGLIVLAGVRKARTEQSWSRSLFLLLSVNSVFEMWLFAGGSLFFVMYLAAAYQRGSPTRPDEVAEDSHSGLAARSIG